MQRRKSGRPSPIWLRRTPRAYASTTAITTRGRSIRRRGTNRVGNPHYHGANHAGSTGSATRETAIDRQTLACQSVPPLRHRSIWRLSEDAAQNDSSNRNSIHYVPPMFLRSIFIGLAL